MTYWHLNIQTVFKVTKTQFHSFTFPSTRAIYLQSLLAKEKNYR